MKIYQGSHLSWEPGPDAAVTVGVLDGVHRGHRRLLSRLVSDGLIPTVATFEPHPVEVLSPGFEPRLITTLAERIDLLEEIGVEQLAVLDLNGIRDFDPDQFVVDILVERLAAKKVVVGVDFQFGKNRAGTVAHLNRLGDEHGFDVEVVDLVVAEGVVSSSRIRGMIEAGDVDGAAGLLESRYTVTGRVVRGDRRGRELGVPTANLIPPPRKVIPADGVYAAFARIAGRSHIAAVNVGVRPTFDGPADRLIEAHILDFDEEIYDEEIVVEFVARLRDELKFGNADELVAQMRRDVDEVRRRLGSAA